MFKSYIRHSYTKSLESYINMVTRQPDFTGTFPVFDGSSSSLETGMASMSELSVT